MRSFAVSLAALFMTTMYWSGMTPGWPVLVTGAGVCATPLAGVSATARFIISFMAHAEHDHDHAHDHGHDHGHGHTHGLVDPSIKRSREGLRAVGLALVVLGATAVIQLVVFVASGSVALLADLIHNFGDAATAIPLAIAFALRSARAERIAGLAVVLAIFASACVAGYEAIVRLIDPKEPEYLGALALAGAVGFAGNW